MSGQLIENAFGRLGASQRRGHFVLRQFYLLELATFQWIAPLLCHPLVLHGTSKSQPCVGIDVHQPKNEVLQVGVLLHFLWKPWALRVKLFDELGWMG